MDIGIMETAHGTIECQACGGKEGFVVEYHPTPGVLATRFHCPHCYDVVEALLIKLGIKMRK